MPASGSRRIGRVSEITHVAPFKPGGPAHAPGIRYADRCRLVLDAFGRLEQEGFVSPVRRFGGIHFARWALIDADTRLLFTTNFDGLFDDYIAAFTREIPWSLDLIWSNCVDYPEDEAPANAGGPRRPGASNFPLFVKFVKRFQIPADLFYAHYGHLTGRDIQALQIFREQTLRMLEQGERPTEAELLRRTMEHQNAVERASEDLPRRPFPHPESAQQLADADREQYARRIAAPIRALYGYEDATLAAILREFRLPPVPHAE